MLKLPRADFVMLTDRHPAMLKPIAVTLARRLADTLASDDQAQLSHPRTIAVIGAAQSAVPEAFRQGLARALSRFGQVSAVDSSTLAAALPGETNLDSATVTSWFNKQELRYHYVLYFADAELTPFSRKTIRQADQVLIVGAWQANAESAPAPDALERFVFDIHGVVGSHVNLTSRIQSYTTGGQILISDTTRREVGHLLKTGTRMEVKAKGIEHPVTLYEAFGDRQAAQTLSA